MKKKLAFALAAVTLLSALTACGAGASSASPATSAAASASEGAAAPNVTLGFSWWGNQVRNERTETVCNQYTAENPNVTFNLMPINGKEYWDKVTTLVAGKEAPVLMQEDYAKFAIFVEKNIHQPMDEYVADGTIDLTDIPEAYLSSGKLNDQYYAFSLGVNAPCMIYDATLLEEAGIEVPEQMTWEEFEAVSKEVYEKTGVKTSLGTYYGPQHQIDISIRNAGKHTYGDDNKSLGFDDANLVTRVFANYEKSIKEGYGLPAESYTGVTSVEQAPIIAGNAWNEFFFSNQVVAAQTAMGDRKVGIVMNPEFSDKTADGCYLKPAVMLSMCNQSTPEEMKEAAKVVNYLLNSVEANKVLLGERGAPINSKVREAISPLVDAPTKATFDYISFVQDKSAPINPADPAAASEINTNALRMMNEVLYGQSTAEKAGQEWMETAQKALKNA